LNQQEHGVEARQQDWTTRKASDSMKKELGRLNEQTAETRRNLERENRPWSKVGVAGSRPSMGNRKKN